MAKSYNTKLDTYQRQELAELLQAFPDAEFYVSDRTTICIVKSGNDYRATFATCSEKEKKQRNKVGVYYTLFRMADGEYATICYDVFWQLIIDGEGLNIPKKWCKAE